MGNKNLETFGTTHDVVVVGLGIMGSSALFHLAEQGVRVIGIDAHGPLNLLGSSHGRSRIFRRAYWEGGHYVPLLDRSYVGWQELDDAIPESVAVRTGGLFVGPPKSALVRGSVTTARNHGIEHEYLSGQDIRDQFPAFHVDDDAVAVYEPEAMMLDADRARLGYLSRAVNAGADINYGRTVRSIEPGPAQTVVVRGDGWQLDCATVVLAVGAWTDRFLPIEIAPLIQPMRIPVYTFNVRRSRQHEHRADRFPVFLYENSEGALMYGLPESNATEVSVKIGFHNRQLTPVDIDGDRQPPTDSERTELWRAVKDLLPGIRNTGGGISCVYTMCRDESFLIGRSREIANVVYASACSGHGFKFAPGIGEILAQLVVDGHSDLDITRFDPIRL